MTPKKPHKPLEAVRLDKWLWAARFYKTRSVAAEAVDGGKVQVNGQRVKRSKQVEAGDRLRVKKAPYEFTLDVKALSDRRGPASVAQALYEELPESVAAREKLKTQMKLQPSVHYERKGRPTKKDRRRIDRLKRG